MRCWLPAVLLFKLDSPLIPAWSGRTIRRRCSSVRRMRSNVTELASFSLNMSSRPELVEHLGRGSQSDPLREVHLLRAVHRQHNLLPRYPVHNPLHARLVIAPRLRLLLLGPFSLMRLYPRGIARSTISTVPRGPGTR